MATIQDIFEVAKLAAAAYVRMDDFPNFTAADFSNQADLQGRLPEVLADRTFDPDRSNGNPVWTIPNGGYLGNDGTGYAATLFKRGDETVLAIRRLVESDSH